MISMEDFESKKIPNRNRSRIKSLNNEAIFYTKEFKHSGNNYSRRRKCVVVDNNAIN